MVNHRVVVVGCGSMSNTWIDYAVRRENVTIVGLVDLDLDNAKKMSEEKGLNVPIFTDISEAIFQTKATVVFDVTVPSAHKQVVTAASKAGCHVFGEKPMAESMDQAREMLDVVQETNKSYAVMQNRRYGRNIRAFRRLLTEKKIGTVGSIHADFFLGPHFGGFRDIMDNPLIVDMAIHTFDQARFLTGADPVSVYCHEYNPPGSWYKGNAAAVCIFEMNDGSVFSYRGSWCAEGLPTSWESDWRVTGSHGSIRWDGDHDPICEVVNNDTSNDFFREVKKVYVSNQWMGQPGHAGCLDEMFAAIEQERFAETDCKDNIKSLAMVFGAVESAKSGKKVLLFQ